MKSADQWLPESEAAELLAIKQGTLRSMRRDGRLDPGVHWIFATGTAGGPVNYDITAIRKTLVERTIAMAQQAAESRAAAKQQTQQSIETYEEAGLEELNAEVQS